MYYQSSLGGNAFTVLPAMSPMDESSLEEGQVWGKNQERTLDSRFLDQDESGQEDELVHPPFLLPSWKSGTCKHGLSEFSTCNNTLHHIVCTETVVAPIERWIVIFNLEKEWLLILK